VAQRKLVTLFKHENKANNPKSPDFVGQGMVEIKGILYPARIAAWCRKSEKAGDYINVDVEVTYEHEAKEAGNS
jgi:hypothetical protein